MPVLRATYRDVARQSDTSRASLQQQERPPRPCDRSGGVADERSVDMAERRGDQPAPETGPQLPRPIRVGLSPVQAAYAAFAGHFMDCEHCRDIDRGQCDEAARLWQAYKAEDGLARHKLTGGR